MDDDTATRPGPNCIFGEIDAAPESFVALRYYTNQPYGGENTAVDLNEFGALSIGLTTETAHPIYVEIHDFAAANTYCAIWPGGSGTTMIPWQDFNTNCETGSGLAFEPGTSLIDEVGIMVLSTGSQEPYEICLTQLEEELTQSEPEQSGAALFCSSSGPRSF